MQEEILQTAQRYRGNSDNQGKALVGFKSRVAVMADSYGAAGGELANRMYQGDITRNHFMETGYDAVGKIRDVYDGIDNPFERQRISNAVINALEDRKNPDRHLESPKAKEVYKIAKELLDGFKAEMKTRGYATREDYFTHIKDVDVIDQVLNDVLDPKQESVGGLNQIITDKSRFLKPRSDADIEIRRDLPYVLSTYVRSVSKELAYRDGVDYYYSQFQKDIPVALRRNSTGRAVDFMKNVLDPKKGRGTAMQVMNWVRNQMYRNFLGMNFKASLQNLTQPEFARWRWSPEADALRKEVWSKRKELTGSIADAIDVTSQETPRFLELMKEAGKEKKEPVSEKFNEIDTFQRSERRNWSIVEMGSIFNSAMKEKSYADALKNSGGDELKAVGKVLEDQTAFDRAVREAAVTSAETQVAAAPSMRGEYYDHPLTRIAGMFTAFKTRQLQILGQTLGRQEGINGARAKTILRRGLSNDVAPVEVLREVETNRVAMEKMLKDAKTHKEDLGLSYDQVQEYVDYLKSQEKDLNGIIAQLEPAGGSTARRYAMVGRYAAKVAGISMFFSVLWDLVDSAVGDKDTEKNILSDAMWKAFWDISPWPVYGANPQKFFVSPVTPNLEHASVYGKFSGRGLARDVVSYGFNAVPFGGLIDRATGKRISKAVVDIVAPRKKQSKLR